MPSCKDGSFYLLFFNAHNYFIKTKNKTHKNALSRIWTADPWSGKQWWRPLYHATPPWAGMFHSCLRLINFFLRKTTAKIELLRLILELCIPSTEDTYPGSQFHKAPRKVFQTPKLILKFQEPTLVSKIPKKWLFKHQNDKHQFFDP